MPQVDPQHPVPVRVGVQHGQNNVFRCGGKMKEQVAETLLDLAFDKSLVRRYRDHGEGDVGQFPAEIL